MDSKKQGHCLKKSCQSKALPFKSIVTNAKVESSKRHPKDPERENPLHKK